MEINPSINGNEVAILAAVAHNLHMSVRQLERGSGISRSSVWRILHRRKFHPYLMSLHQELYANNFDARIVFCCFALQQLQNNNTERL